MATDKRKAQLADAQRRLMAERSATGWKRLWIHPAILERVKALIAELEKYKD